MNQELNDLWGRVARPPTAHLNARPHPTAEGVWLGIDDDARRHLLVELSASSEEEELILSTHGLAVNITVLAVGDRSPTSWLDVACLDPSLNEMFLTVVRDIVEELVTAGDDRPSAVRRALRTWQWFWANRASPLSRDEVIGLLAELWFLDRWLPLPSAVDYWRGPEGDRHDFVHPELSVEVKGTQVRHDGPARHRITRLDQLEDPQSGVLYLFSLQVIPDRLATNSLEAVHERLAEKLSAEPSAHAVFQQRLAQAGWNPAHQSFYRDTWRVVGEELYRVEDRFPRLTSGSFSGGIPAGVDDVTWTLDLAACAEHRVATHPDLAAGILEPLRR